MKELILREVKNGYTVTFQDEVYVERSAPKIIRVIVGILNRREPKKCSKKK